MISAKDKEYWEPHKCPVCGKFGFPHHGSYEVCEVCGWQDDGVQEDDPNFGGANWETLNGYKALYKAGLHDASDEKKMKWLEDNGFLDNREDDGGHEFYIIGQDEGVE